MVDKTLYTHEYFQYAYLSVRLWRCIEVNCKETKKSDLWTSECGVSHRNTILQLSNPSAHSIPSNTPLLEP